MCGFVQNRSINWIDRLGLACSQKENSFKWTIEPSIFIYKVEYESLGGGVMGANRLTMYWKGEAEIVCCCIRKNRTYEVTKKGEMIGSYEADVSSDGILITGGSAMPMSVATPVSIGEAIAEVVDKLIGGLGDLPAASASEIRFAKIGINNAIEAWRNETPTNYTWKDGWPCKDA